MLALDASGACWSVALLDGEEVTSRTGGDSRQATADMPGVIQALLAEDGVDAIAVTTGPGSFTGLRGALALAHGLALGAGVPVLGVTVAEALRQGRTGDWDGPVWVVLDARRAGRLFLDTGAGMAATSLDDLPRPTGPVLLLGDAAAAAAALVPGAVVGVPQAVVAADVAQVALQRLAGVIAPCAAQPLYVDPPAARP